MTTSWGDFLDRSGANASAVAAKAHRERIVWHYTSAAVFDQIVEKHVMWATDVGCLNDTDEIGLGIRRFKKRMASTEDSSLSPKDRDSALDLDLVRELVDTWEDYPFDGSAFTVSFSRHGDDNSQWERYADNGGGVAIGIRQGSYMPILGAEAQVGTSTGVIEDIPFYWTEMLYKRRKQNAAIDSAASEMLSGMSRNAYPEDGIDMSRLIQDQAISEYARAAASIKNAGFRAEKEVRYVISRPDSPDAIFTRLADDKTVPFVKITGAPADTDRATDPRWLPQYQGTPLPLPIAKVRLGPKNANDVLAVTDLLHSNGYGKDVRVVKSKSTLR